MLNNLVNLQAQTTPNAGERRRRESSFTQSLDDPVKFMDMVKKTLGQNEDEKTPKQKRTHLENIDEEALPVDFMTKQFSNFSIKHHQKDLPRVEEGTSSKHSHTFFQDRNFQQIAPGNDE